MNHLIFAYGSMMHPEEIRRRCPSARFRFRAMIPDHRLCFPRYSAKRAGGVAGIQSAPGSFVWGVVWAITPGELTILDRAEGFFGGDESGVCNYIRRSLTVLREGEPSGATTVEFYDATPNGRSNSPAVAYLQLIIDGGRAHGLTEQYLLSVRASSERECGDLLGTPEHE